MSHLVARLPSTFPNERKVEGRTMNFQLTQSWMLGGLLLLAIPYIIHLMFRQKPLEVPIGSVRFLREIMEKHHRRQKVLRWLLMTLRMVCIALIALMFARPFFNKLTQQDTVHDCLVILIDQSASMQLHNDNVPLINEAVEQARKLVEQHGDGAAVEIAFFDQQVCPLKAGDDSRRSAAELLSQWSAPRQSYAATDFAAAFRWAGDICATSKTKTQQLHIFTDLQRSGLAWSDVNPMPESAVVKIHDLGRDSPTNVAILDSTPKRMVVRPGESTSVQVRVMNSSPFPMEEVPVTLEAKNGTRTIYKREKVKLEADSIKQVAFELPELGAGMWHGSTSVELVDDLSFDNRRHFGVLSALQFRVLIVDGVPSDIDFLSESFHLQNALTLASRGGSNTASPYLASTDSLDLELENFDVVILANVEKVDEYESEKLKRFVDSGGGLIVFAGDQSTADSFQFLEQSELLPGKIIKTRESSDLPWRIESWDKDHSIFAPFNEPQHGDLRGLAFRGIVDIQPTGPDAVVAKFFDGSPFVIEKPIGDQGGGVILVATSCSNRWSNWTQSELYLPVVHQLLGHLTDLNLGERVQQTEISDSAKNEVIPKPGVFKAGKSWKVVNVSPRESETDRCSKDDVIKRFGLVTGEADSPVVASIPVIGNTMDIHKNEMWHWILFALITMGTIEFFLSNRTIA